MADYPVMPQTDRIPRGILVLALLVVILWGVGTARPFLIPVCLAALLAFLMNPLVRVLARYRVPQWIAVTISSFVLILPIALMLYFIVMEIQSLVVDFPSITAALNHQLAVLSHSETAQRLHLPISLSALGDRLASEAGHGISFALTGLRTFLETGSNLVLVIIFAIVMLGSRDHLRKSGERILAQFEGIESARMLDEVTALIERFLLGRLLIVAIVGLVSMIIIKLFGMGYSFLLGFFLGLMTVIPEVGFIISLVPIIIVAFAQGHSLVSTLILIGVLFVVHTLEGYLLTPKIVGKKLNINALTTFLGLFGGGLLWGVWGMFLSVPILGVLRIALSAAPHLQPWGELLAERSDWRLSLSLMRRRRQVA